MIHIALTHCYKLESFFNIIKDIRWQFAVLRHTRLLSPLARSLGHWSSSYSFSVRPCLTVWRLQSILVLLYRDSLVYCNCLMQAEFYYRAMLRRARYCYGKSSVHPSVRDGDVEVSWSHRLEIFKNNFISKYTPRDMSNFEWPYLRNGWADSLMWRCCLHLPYRWKFSAASRGFPATARLSCCFITVYYDQFIC